MVQVLSPFFVTRQIFAGAGKVLQTPRGFHYCPGSARETVDFTLHPAMTPGTYALEVSGAGIFVISSVHSHNSAADPRPPGIRRSEFYALKIYLWSERAAQLDVSL